MQGGGGSCRVVPVSSVRAWMIHPVAAVRPGRDAPQYEPRSPVGFPSRRPGSCRSVVVLVQIRVILLHSSGTVHLCLNSCEYVILLVLPDPVGGVDPVSRRMWNTGIGNRTTRRAIVVDGVGFGADGLQEYCL